MQYYFAILIGIIAFAYVIKIFTKQLSHTENNPKCDTCPVPDLLKSKGID